MYTIRLIGCKYFLSFGVAAVLSCAGIARCQSAGSSQSGTATGSGSVTNLMSQGSGGSAASNAALYATVPANVGTGVSVGASLPNAGEQVSENPLSGVSSLTESSGRESGGQQYGRSAWGASQGWGQQSSTAKVSARRSSAFGLTGAMSPSSPLLSSGATAEGAGRKAKSSSGESGAGQGGGLVPTATHYSSLLASPQGQVLIQKASVLNASHKETQGMSSEENGASSGQGKEAREMTASARYTGDFPDSTKNTAVISPPDLANSGVFDFDPYVSGEFPDLANREFLRPSLRVGEKSSTTRQKEDLYQRIENRLKEYREAENKGQGLKNGLKQDKLTGSTLKKSLTRNGLEGNGLEEGLRNELSTGLTP
jgi:hypothetical protein